MKLVFLFLMVTLAWVTADPIQFLGHEYQRTPIGDAIDKATLKMLKESYEIGKDKNVVTSPLGVLLLLALYSAGSGEETRQEITNLLGGGKYKALSNSYISLSEQLAEMDSSYLTLANKIYVSDKYELSEGFAITATSFKSEAEKLDFTDAQKAADIINEWSDKKTQGHIKKPVSPDILTPDTAAALFNVIFFQGHWNVPFNASYTKDEDFHVDKNTIVKKPTMKLLQSLFYRESEELGAKMIELPYKETGFRMVVVLPNEVDGLPSVLEKAAQKGLLDDVFQLSPAGAEVDLSFPKFEIKSKLDLTKILPKVGISKIFEEPATEMVKHDSLIVSKAFQEAFVKVDEKGATAGAFTGVIAVLASSLATPPPPMKFAVDRPFLFLILHEDKTVFAGTYTH